MKRYLALKASAGSGKTFALSVRFIALILSGANIAEIVALTFTKKAANEMKERVVETFLNLEKKLSELAAMREILGLGEDKILALRDERMADFLQSDLKIGTFDSFFTGILRQFSLNLGLSADFSVSSDLTNLQRQKFVEKISRDPSLLRSLAEFIVVAEKSQNSFFETLERFYENFDSVKADKDAKFPNDEAVRTALGNLLDYAVSNGGSQTAQNAFLPGSPAQIAQRGFLEHESLEYRTFSKIYTPKLDELFGKLKEALRSYFRQFEEYKLNELNRFLALYKEAKLELDKEQNSLSFSDINKLAYELLTKNIDKQMLYFRLDGRINHLLIDEFQDTNVTQYEIILPLVAEIVSGYGQNGLGSFFYVGDTKQSIYRFRGGKKELFDKLKAQFTQIASDGLDTNYRSLKGLVKFTNAVFKDKILNFIEQKAPKKDDERLNFAVSQECEYFESEVDDHGFLKVVSSEDIVSGAISEVKNFIQNGVELSDITLLCWKNEDINKLANALSEQGINSVSEGSLGLLASPYARALVEYAKFCLFGDKIYKFNTQAIIKANAPRLEIRAESTAFESLHYLAMRLGVDTSNSDVLRLFELTSEYENLADFIFKLDSFEGLAMPKSSRGVKIMTVHKSKGLEFPHVIVCDKMGADRTDTSSFLAEYDVKNGWQIMHKIKGKENFDEDFRALKNRANELEKEEDMNKIYVAFTRATCSLVVVKNAGPGGRSPSFFGAYEKKTGERVEYLDLKDFTFGKILAGSPTQTSKENSEILPQILQISRQEAQSPDKQEGANLRAIYIGLAFHYLLEMAAKFDETGLIAARNSMQNKFHKFLCADDLDDVFKRGLMLVNDAKFREFTDAKEIYKEQPLKFQGALRQIDLLCVGESEICVIDYKSSDKNIDENVLQVSEYKKAIAEFYPNSSVRAVIFYALRDKISYIEV